MPRERKLKLTGIKQRISRLPLQERRKLHEWLTSSLQDATNELKAAHAKLLSKLKPGTEVLFHSHRGAVRKATKTYVYIDFELPIRYDDGKPVKGVWSQVTNSGSSVQLVHHLPGYGGINGTFDVYACKDGQAGVHFGRTPIFAHALEFALAKTCRDFDVLVRYGKDDLLVTPVLRAQFLSVRQQLQAELLAKEKPVAFSLPANNPKEFVAWMERQQGQIPEDLR